MRKCCSTCKYYYWEYDGYLLTIFTYGQKEYSKPKFIKNSKEEYCGRWRRYE